MGGLSFSPHASRYDHATAVALTDQDDSNPAKADEIRPAEKPLSERISTDIPKPKTASKTAKVFGAIVGVLAGLAYGIVKLATYPIRKPFGLLVGKSKQAQALHEAKQKEIEAKQAVLKKHLGKTPPLLDLSMVKTSVTKLGLSSTAPGTSTGEIEHFNQCIGRMQAALEIKDPNESNREFIIALREALKSNAYQALKKDPNNPAIKTLHRCCVAIYHDVHVSEAYEEFGHAIGKQTPGGKASVTSEEGFGSFLKQTWEAAAQKLFSEDSDAGRSEGTFRHTAKKVFTKIAYAFEHWQQTKASLAAGGGTTRAIAGMAYDSHVLDNANNPFALGTLTSEVEGETAVTANFRTGSPTIDDEISPEFLGYLQAVTNNQTAKKPDPTIPSKVLYTNLQNIAKPEGEGARSRAIMALGDEYSDAFVGITLTKDSPFYGSDGSWESADKFSADFRAQLLDDRSFTLEKRGLPHNKAHGFYFPGGKAKWAPIIDKALKIAEARFAGIEATDEGFDAKAAFQEHVYLMIQLQQEQAMATELIDRKLPPVVAATRNCKECIDRGGTENAKYFYSTLPAWVETQAAGDPELKEQYKAHVQAMLKGETPKPLNTEIQTAVEKMFDFMAGSYLGYALSARDRLVLRHRSWHMDSFMKLVDPWQFQDDMADMGLNFTSCGYDRTISTAANMHGLTKGASGLPGDSTPEKDPLAHHQNTSKPTPTEPHEPPEATASA
jgi:hypothetical protein